MELLLVLLIIGVFVVLKMKANERRRRADAAAGVIAKFMDLRLTRDELLVGGTRIQLAGLNARVDDAAHRQSIYLTINGPTTTLLREMPYKKNRRAGFQARSFAESLNLQVRAPRLPGV